MPPLDNAARLPIGLALILIAAWVLQLIARDPAPPPDAGPIGGGAAGSLAPPAMLPVRADPVVLARAIFAPNVAPGASAAPAVSDPLAGHAIIGALRVERLAYAIVRMPDRRIARLPLGGRVAGWRLRGITEAAALLSRGTETITVPFGSANGAATKTDAGAEGASG